MTLTVLVRAAVVDRVCCPGWTRTTCLRCIRAALSPDELPGIAYTDTESNRGPSLCKSAALPLSYQCWSAPSRIRTGVLLGENQGSMT